MTEARATDGAFLCIDLPPRITIFDGVACKDLRPEETAQRVGDYAALVRGVSEEDAVVGLIFETGADLLAAWLGCLAAGRAPLILQFPNAKQDLLTYARSIAACCRAAAVSVVVLSARAAAVLGTSDLPVPTACLEDVPTEPAAPVHVIPHGRIVQMSSGTTGHRKPMSLTTRAIVAHVRRFNEVVRLTPDDVTVSWLPLYHDMGFVACFCMPLVLGSPIVMMDPMTWVADPGRLFDLIEKVRGSVCYMPNFGFEVMTRFSGRDLSSMRLWVSCSETVSAGTVERFLTRLGIDPQTFAACYGMAENVFAVAFRTGFRQISYEGRTVVSCGPPVPGTQIRLDRGELLVRSPESIRSYNDDVCICDEEGFYRTGDMGVAFNGEVAVLGRVHDVINQAGEKYFLSDIDLIANEVLPGVRGRLATVAADRGIGTETPLLLVEADDFFERAPSPDDLAEIRRRSGLQTLEMRHVPPRFITKTSSGKANRRLTAASLAAVAAQEDLAAASRNDAGEELQEMLRGKTGDAPVAQAFDSLSFVMLRLLTEERGLALDPSETVGALRERLAAAREERPSTGDEAEKCFNVVCLGDQDPLIWVNHHFLDVLGEAVKAPARFTHLLLPPVPIILSDLVFMDYMAPRLEEERRKYYGQVAQHLDILRRADVILVDNYNEIRLLTYGTAFHFLNHRFERDPRSDLIATRWQRYNQLHEFLSTGVATGRELLDRGPAALNRSLTALGRYLDTPVIRIAYGDEESSITADWEVRLKEKISLTDVSEQNQRRVFEFARTLISRISEQAGRRRLGPPPFANRIRRAEMGHFCSFHLDKGLVDRALAQFDSFILWGERSSAPYIEQEIRRLGKPYVCLPTQGAITDEMRASGACVIVKGPVGSPPQGIPFIAAVSMNIDAPSFGGLDDERARSFQDFPPPGDDLRCDPGPRTDGLYLPD
jgi:acyl-CoA synthetase (AMP-forming)/AMP-acid ligase II